tara:strand:+ start:699 stop:1064 length:366 start_codon:yes stop_codon:yes gene_type:complete
MPTFNDLSIKVCELEKKLDQYDSDEAVRVEDLMLINRQIKTLLSSIGDIDCQQPQSEEKPFVIDVSTKNEIKSCKNETFKKSNESFRFWNLPKNDFLNKLELTQSRLGDVLPTNRLTPSSK